MPLAVEQHDGGLWLVSIPHPTSDSVLLARFPTDAEAAIWKREHDHSLVMAREVGRAGVA
jgi:hypothetical protein